MLMSMTGYGRSEATGDGFAHVFEVKSVNSRYLDLKWRLPAAMRGLEAAWEKTVRRFASRGRVEISLDLDVQSPALLGVSLNLPLAEAMLGQLEALARRRHMTFEPDLTRLLSIQSLWREASGGPDPALAASLDRGLEAALVDWNASRSAEGKALAADLRGRFFRLRDLAEDIRGRVPPLVEEKRTALAERIRTAMAAAGAEYSEDRMLQEAAIQADRLDVSEELTRLAHHLDRLEELLSDGGDAGKRLDFLIQETFREINTCGNKCQDPEISRLAVDFKAELERCREQAQNLE